MFIFEGYLFKLIDIDLNDTDAEIQALSISEGLIAWLSIDCLARCCNV
jgi:hypothetical protein